MKDVRRIAVGAIFGGDVLKALGLDPMEWNVTRITVLRPVVEKQAVAHG